MKKIRFVAIVAVLILNILMLNGCSNGQTYPCLKIARYSINDEFLNADETCKFKLKSVEVSKRIEFDNGQIYESDDYVLTIKAEVNYSNYALKEFGVKISNCVYYINYRKTDGVINACSVLDKQSDMLCDLSSSLSAPYEFSAEKQNYQGTIYLCFKLKAEIYEYLHNSAADEATTDYAVTLDFNGQTTNMKNTFVEIGCSAKDITFTEVWSPNKKI